MPEWENDSGNGAAVPGKAGIHRPRAGRKRIKGEKTHGQQSTGEHCGDAVCHCNDGFGKIHSVSGQKAGRGHHKAAGRERESLGDQGGGAARAKLAEDKAKAENEVLRREAAALREQLAKERRRESRREERAEQAAAEQVAADEKQG